MADPTRYQPGFDYSDYEDSNPTLPKPGHQLDNDFAKIAQSVDETIDALKDIRRSDGKLNNGIVTLDTLSPLVKQTFNGLEWVEIVGESIGKVEIVADNIVDVGAVASISDEVAAVGQNVGSVVTVAQNIDSVNQVAADMPDVVVVAGAVERIEQIADEVEQDAAAAAASAAQAAASAADAAQRVFDVYPAKTQFAGDGSRTAFNTGRPTLPKAAVDVYVDGQYQQDDAYTLTGGVVHFVEPPPAPQEGQEFNIEIRTSGTTALAIGVDDAVNVNAPAGLVLADAVLTVETMAALESLPVPILRAGKTTVINVLGFHEEDDGGGGRFYWQGNSNEAAIPGMIIVPESNPASGRWKRVIEGEKIFVEQCGAKADYTPLSWTDNTAAVQAALNVASAWGKAVDGNGTFAIAGQLTTTVNMTIVSNGTLKFKKPGTSTGPRIIASSLAPGAAPTKGTVRIQGVSFEGDFNENPTEEDGRQIVAIVDAEDVTIQDCDFYAGRHFGLVVNNARRARILNNRVDLTCRDGIAAWASYDLLIEGNTVTRTDDNGISAHVTTSDSPRARANVKILNNTLVDNAGPIQTLGAGDIIIRGNIIYRPKAFGIAVRQVGGGSGGHPFAAMNSILVEENIIHDLLGNQWRVNGNPGQTQASAPYIIIGSPVDTAPDWTANPDGTYYTTQANQLPMRNVKVRRNILTRTLLPVAAYSDWGFGNGAFVAHAATDGAVFRDSAVTDADLRCIGIQVNGAVWDGDFSDNTIFVGYAGVQFVASGGAAVDNLYRNVRVSRNMIFRNEMAWMVVSDSPTKHYDIEFDGNTVDGDPLCTHANRGPNGTWLAATFPAVGQFANVSGLRVKRNTIRNVARTVFGTGSSLNHFEDNLIACNPAQTGFSTSNVGVGDVPLDPNQYWATIEDGDPASATFGGNINTCARSAVAMPNTGKYVAGMFVRSRTIAVQGTAGSQFVLHGWIRLTTGTAHTLNTDWAECRAPTGT